MATERISEVGVDVKPALLWVNGTCAECGGRIMTAFGALWHEGCPSFGGRVWHEPGYTVADYFARRDERRPTDIKPRKYDDVALESFVCEYPAATVTAFRLNHETIRAQADKISKLREQLHDLTNARDELDERLRNSVVCIVTDFPSHRYVTIHHLTENDSLSRPLCPNCKATDCEGCLTGMAPTRENEDYIARYMRRES